MLALLELTILAILFSRRGRMSLYKERKKWLKETRFQEGKIVERPDPPPQGPSYLTPNNIGICRIAFSVDDIDGTYADLQAKKVQFVAPLKTIMVPDDATRLKPSEEGPVDREHDLNLHTFDRRVARGDSQLNSAREACAAYVSRIYCSLVARTRRLLGTNVAYTNK
jgi:hypothetical protein